MEPGQLYKELKVTTGDGETATLEELKNSFAERAQEARGTAEKAAELDRREASLATDVQSLGVLDAMQAVPEGIRAQANQYLQQMAEREWSKFTALVPEMQDDATRIQFDQDVEKFLKPYGLTPYHFGTRNVGMLRLIRDVIKDRKALKALTAPKPKKAPEPVKRNRVAKETQRPTAQRGSSKRQQEIASIADILRDS